MNLARYMKRSCCALGAGLALAATTAFADTLTPQTSVPQVPAIVVVSDNTETMAEVRGSKAPRSYPSSEVGVRRAAEQGPEALRRYIWRTRMIYNYNFWNFIKQQ